MSRALAAALLVFLAGAAAPVAAPDCDGYRVVRGDTLTRIARRCGSSVAAIARASSIRNPDLILVGQRLVIPGQRLARTEPPPPRAARPAPRAESSLVYRMARGDTLYSLARWSRSGLPALLSANPGIDPHKIEIGDAVRLPAGAVAPDRARARERGAAAPAPPRTARTPPPATARTPPAPREPAPRRPREREPEPAAM